MVLVLGHMCFYLFYMFAMNGSNKAPFSTKPVPSDIVFDGGSDSDGLGAWKYVFVFV